MGRVGFFLFNCTGFCLFNPVCDLIHVLSHHFSEMNPLVVSEFIILE